MYIGSDLVHNLGWEPLGLEDKLGHRKISALRRLDTSLSKTFISWPGLIMQGLAMQGTPATQRNLTVLAIISRPPLLCCFELTTVLPPLLNVVNSTSSTDVEQHLQ